MVATPTGSQLVDEIGTKFQRLPDVFGVHQLNASSLNAVRHKPEVGNPKWRLDGWISDFRFGQTTFTVTSMLAASRTAK